MKPSYRCWSLLQLIIVEDNFPHVHWKWFIHIFTSPISKDCFNLSKCCFSQCSQLFSSLCRVLLSQLVSQLRWSRTTTKVRFRMSSVIPKIQYSTYGFDSGRSLGISIHCLFMDRGLWFSRVNFILGGTYKSGSKTMRFSGGRGSL